MGISGKSKGLGFANTNIHFFNMPNFTISTNETAFGTPAGALLLQLEIRACAFWRLLPSIDFQIWCTTTVFDNIHPSLIDMHEWLSVRASDRELQLKWHQYLFFPVNLRKIHRYRI